jgi:anthranilate/para-aminobenzoate synthase component I
MTYTVHESNIRTIGQDDPGFYIHDGITVAARAGVVIDSKCPRYEEETIRRAFSLGYIRLVANVKDNELMWEELGQ